MILPKTIGQMKYLNKLKTLTKPILVVNGPAGTGKTSFACQVAAEQFMTNKIHKIILTRPMIAVDEDIGYLPGDMNSKFGPWSSILTDAFENYMTKSNIKRLIQDEIIQPIPIGFMRGKTFKDTFVIADEMQNSTLNQMKMLLTRIGENSNMIITGDIDQSDIQDENGLEYITKKITPDLEFIESIQLTHGDICRHPALNEILNVLYK